MPILTLTTDFGTKSFDIAALKGKLMCASPGITIVDISNNIDVFSKINAAYELRNAALNFPAKTIHFTNINIKEGFNRYLIVEKDEQYFILPDNGMICLMFPKEDFKVFVIEELESSFSYNEINKTLCKIVKAAEKNEEITQFGTSTTYFKKEALMRPSIYPDMIRASVIYVDHYDNVILNISKEIFNNFVRNQSFSISIGITFKSHKISKHYSEVEFGDLVTLFNDAGLLELAINNGKATQLLGLSYGSNVLIELI